MKHLVEVFIIDDLPVFREGIKSVLARGGRYRVIGEASRAQQGIEAVCRLKPDLVLVDLFPPDMDGVVLVRKLKMSIPHAVIIGVSMHAKPEVVYEALQAGARAYVSKDAPAETLIQAIDAVGKGRLFLDNAVYAAMAERYGDWSIHRDTEAKPRLDVLTLREREVLKLVADGLSSKQIARRLFISQKTVENHRARIMRKLGLDNLADLIKCALRLGLVDIYDWKKS